MSQDEMIILSPGRKILVSKEANYGSAFECKIGFLHRKETVKCLNGRSFSACGDTTSGHYCEFGGLSKGKE